MNFIPMVNTHHHQILTMEHWKCLGVETLAYSLNALIIKPGRDVLKDGSLHGLKAWLGWSGQLVLITPSLLPEQTLTLHSAFDGSKLRLTSRELGEIIHWVQPDQVVEQSQVPSEYMHDRPMVMGTEGMVSADQPKQRITDVQYVLDQAKLDDSCDCITCAQGLTRSYLHHLWNEVPILAQRYLVMHQVRQEVLRLRGKNK